MKKIISVAIDDMREYSQAEVDIILRNENCLEIIESLYELGFSIDYLFLDNDLGGNLEGIDILKVLFFYDVEEYGPVVVELVTANIIACDRMRNLLEEAGYAPKDVDRKIYVYQASDNIYRL